MRQLPAELRIPPRWPLARVLMREPLVEPLTRVSPERTLASPVIRVRREILPVLTRVRRVRTQPSPLQVRRALPLVLMQVLRVLRVRTLDSPGIRVRRERFLERVLPVVRLARPEAVRVAVPRNSKQVPLKTHC